MGILGARYKFMNRLKLPLLIVADLPRRGQSELPYNPRSTVHWKLKQSYGQETRLSSGIPQSGQGL